MAMIKKQTISGEQNMEKPEPSHTVRGSVK